MLGPDDFRRVMSHFATGVTIITAWDAENRPTGLTASSFTSVSLHPPLILVCVSQKAQSYPAIKAAGRFAVNILCQGQEGASRRFATSTTAPGEEKFAGPRVPARARSACRCCRTPWPGSSARWSTPTRAATT